MRGRLPKPTALKVIQGTARPDRVNENEPTPPEGEIHCPSWLKGRSRKIWHELQPILTEMGLLTVADAPMFADLCAVRAEFIDAREDVRKRGIEIESTKYDRKTGNAYQVFEDNPSVRIASDANKRATKLEVEFGMSPSSRTRVKAQPKPEKKSALEELRDRRRG